MTNPKDCCDGLEKLTPLPTANRPGLDTLSYRVGTYGAFLETMKARLTTLYLEIKDETTDDPPQRIYPLHALTTREADDPTIALLDAWAATADLLAFYQERLINEGYLRTAIERRSILELARLVGYRLRPGLSSSVYLAFTMEKDFTGEVPAGTRVQSLPEAGQLPQPFESADPLPARAAWNALKPRLTQPQVMSASAHIVYVEGLQVNLTPNDPVLVIGVDDTKEGKKADPFFRRVHTVKAEPEENCTKVFLRGDLSLVKLRSTIQRTPSIPIPVKKVSFPTNPSPFDGKTNVAIDTFSLSWKLNDLDALENKIDRLFSGDITYTVAIGFAGGSLVNIVNIPPSLALDSNGDIVYTFDSTPDWLISGKEYSWQITVTDAISKNKSAIWHFSTSGDSQGDDLPPIPDTGIEPPQPPLYNNPGLDGEDHVRENASKAFIGEVQERLLDKDTGKVESSSLLVNLSKPDLPPNLLQQLITIQKFALEKAKIIFNDWKILPYDYDDCVQSKLDFSEVFDWLQDIMDELDAVSDQVNLRRLLETNKRAFEDETINSQFRLEVQKEAGELPDELDDKFDVDNHELAQLKTDMENVLPTSLISEDDKVARVKGQLLRVQDLELIFGKLGLLVYEHDKLFAGLLEKLQGLIKTNTPITVNPNFSSFVQQLQRHPSVQPSNRLRLERDLNLIFDPDAETTTQMLTAFKPQLANTFYPAWANTDFKPISPLRSFQSLRVKATPFGAKVQPKAITDYAERVVGHKEWPLLGLNVRFTFEDMYHNHHFYIPAQVEIELSWYGEAEQAEIRLDIDTDPRRINLTLLGMDIQVEYSEPSSSGYVKNIYLKLFGKAIVELLYTPRNKKTQVKIIGSESKEIAIPQTRVDIINGSPVKISTDRYSKTLSIENLPIQIPEQLRNILTLDAEYDKITPQSWVVIERPGENKEKQIICRVEKMRTLSKANYGKVTELTLTKPWLKQDDFSLSVARNTIVYAQSEAQPLAKEPFVGLVQGKEIRLNGLYDGLDAGRWLIVSGNRADVPGARKVKASELVMIAGVKHTLQQDDDGNAIPGDTPHTTLILAENLAYTYKRETVTIHGNVVKATHGETRREILGSGNGAKGRQAFTLKHTPLTYLPAPTPQGAENTLEVRVNDVRWHESENLLQLAASERGYITRADNDQQTAVIFGDGIHGARLPTGVENIRALYRSGLGKAGNVPAGQINVLATRPLGLKEAVNPLPASGGADPESRDQARRNVPLALLALDRLVSLSDYADFTRVYAGIDKALAVFLSGKGQTLIHLTIAGADDIPIRQDSDLFRNLEKSLRQHGTLNQPMKIQMRELILLLVSAKVSLHPDYLWEAVEPQIRAALLQSFSFERRDLGQDAYRSEVFAVMQKVPGVAYVDIDNFDGVPENTPYDELQQLGDDLALKSRIPIKTARRQTTHIVTRKSETLASIAERYGMTEVDLWQLNPEVLNPKEPGNEVKIPPQIRPAQLAYFSPDIPDTIILTEVTE